MAQRAARRQPADHRGRGVEHPGRLRPAHRPGLAAGDRPGRVTVGHMVMLHGCTIGEGSLIGIGAVILNGATIGQNCPIGANVLVPEGKSIPRQLAGHRRAREGGARSPPSISHGCARARSTASPTDCAAGATSARRTAEVPCRLVCAVANPLLVSGDRIHIMYISGRRFQRTATRGCSCACLRASLSNLYFLVERWVVATA
jgi:NDP-sugar pyrophosphorylase family protein